MASGICQLNYALFERRASGLMDDVKSSAVKVVSEGVVKVHVGGDHQVFEEGEEGVNAGFAIFVVTPITVHRRCQGRQMAKRDDFFSSN